MRDTFEWCIGSAITDMKAISRCTEIWYTKMSWLRKEEDDHRCQRAIGDGFLPPNAYEHQQGVFFPAFYFSLKTILD